MKHTIRQMGPVLFVAGGLLAGWSLANDTPQKLEIGSAENQKKMDLAAAPGPYHKALDPLVGDWNVEVKFWMASNQPPTISKGTAKSSWILGERFVQEEFNGEFMGKPFRGLSFTGFDNVLKKYRSVWIDDMSTTMVISEGDADTGGKVFTFGGDYSCPLTGEKHKPTKQVYSILSRDKHLFEMYDPTQNDMKTMEIIYIRK
jgi:hypothetical protein